MKTEDKYIVAATSKTHDCVESALKKAKELALKQPHSNYYVARVTHKVTAEAKVEAVNAECDHLIHHDLGIQADCPEKPLTLEVGKTYLTRCGAAVTITKYDSDGDYIGLFDKNCDGYNVADGPALFKSDGKKWGAGYNHGLTIISECTDPARRVLPLPDGLPELPELPEGKSAWVYRGDAFNKKYIPVGDRAVWCVGLCGTKWVRPMAFQEDLHHIEAV